MEIRIEREELEKLLIEKFMPGSEYSTDVRWFIYKGSNDPEPELVSVTLTKDGE